MKFIVGNVLAPNRTHFCLERWNCNKRSTTVLSFITKIDEKTWHQQINEQTNVHIYSFAVDQVVINNNTEQLFCVVHEKHSSNPFVKFVEQVRENPARFSKYTHILASITVKVVSC